MAARRAAGTTGLVHGDGKQPDQATTPEQIPAADRPAGTGTGRRQAANGYRVGGDAAVDEETARHWDELYRGRERYWSGRPNPHLVDVVGALPPAPPSTWAAVRAATRCGWPGRAGG